MTHRETVADAFGRNLDPLAEHAGTFRGLDVDPLELFLEETGPRAPNTERNYRNTFRNWQRFMADRGRHPACPSRSHVEDYVAARADAGAAKSTIKTELTHLGAAYGYWCRDEAFPHATDFDPFDVDPPARLDDGPGEFPEVPLDDLRDVVAAAPRYLDRAVIVLQLKTGMRASEVANVRLPEVNLAHGDLHGYYGDMATHAEVEGRPGSVFVPADREGNKSQRPRVLPLDDEARRCLVRYCLTRPDTGSDRLFLSPRQHVPLDNKKVSRCWREALPDRLRDPEGARPVRSHYGRHRLTTHLSVHRDWPGELVGYLRGDAAGSRSDGSDSLSHYIHVYYSDVEELYGRDVYRLGV